MPIKYIMLGVVVAVAVVARDSDGETDTNAIVWSYSWMSGKIGALPSLRSR